MRGLAMALLAFDAAGLCAGRFGMSFFSTTTKTISKKTTAKTV